jgi:hypothetical protein
MGKLGMGKNISGRHGLTTETQRHRENQTGHSGSPIVQSEVLSATNRVMEVGSRYLCGELFFIPPR